MNPVYAGPGERAGAERLHGALGPRTQRPARAPTEYTRRAAGEWPSGKAADSGSANRRFESYLPSQPYSRAAGDRAHLDTGDDHQAAMRVLMGDEHW